MSATNVIKSIESVSDIKSIGVHDVAIDWGPEACDRESNKCFSGVSGSNDCNACLNFSLHCPAVMGLKYPPSCAESMSATNVIKSIESVSDIPAALFASDIKSIESVSDIKCPPCGNDSDDDMVPMLMSQVSTLRKELEHAKHKGPAQEAKEYMLKDTELFNLVSNFLVPPTHVFFGETGVPKTLFKTQSLVCGKPGKLRFLAIHENIISNQFRLGRQKMKFFGYKVKGWQSDMSEKDAPSLSDATEATCLRGKHAIYVTHEELESIKIRYVRRFFYVYYGLVVKEIGEHKRYLMNLARTLKVSKAAAATRAELLEAYTRVRENFFGGAIPYHLDILQKLNDRLIELGGIQNHIEDSLFTFITSQRSHFDKEIERLSNMNIAPTENQNDSTAGNLVIPGESWFLQAPPSAAEDEHFKKLAKAVISTLIGDQAPPQLFYEEMFGEEWLTEIVEVGNEIGININPTTKWSVIIPAVMNSWDNEALSATTKTWGPSWIKSQIMTWGSYILRHMQNEEEWIISKMGALLSGGKYSNSEGVIMASQFLTILGKSVGLTRAQAVQEVQDASEIVNNLVNDKAALYEQITDLTAHIRGLETDIRNMAKAEARAASAAREAEGNFQKIQSSWKGFVGDVFPSAAASESLSNVAEGLDHAKTELVKKLDEMKTLKERLAAGTEDLEKARADLSTAQAEVTRLDGELSTERVALEDALLNPDCSAAEASVRELLSGNIVALEDKIDTKTVLLKTQLDKITELEKTSAAVATEGVAVKKVEKEYKKKIEDVEETSAAAIKQKNMIIIGLAVFILILIIVVVVK